MIMYLFCQFHLIFITLFSLFFCFRFQPISASLNYYHKYEQMMTRERKNNILRTPTDLREMGQMLEEYPPMEGIFRGCVIGTDGSVANVFIDESMIQGLRACSQLFGDGTFSVNFYIY